jgi:hypothetical protein
LDEIVEFDRSSKGYMGIVPPEICWVGKFGGKINMDVLCGVIRLIYYGQNKRHAPDHNTI